NHDAPGGTRSRFHLQHTVLRFFGSRPGPGPDPRCHTDRRAGDDRRADGRPSSQCPVVHPLIRPIRRAGSLVPAVGSTAWSAVAIVLAVAPAAYGQHDHGIPADPGSVFVSRMGSGTVWLPDAAQQRGYHTTVGSW